jgi:hypothetical protein
MLLPSNNSPHPHMYNFLSDFVGQWHARRVRALEKRIGYRLQFASIPSAWIQGCAAFDLSSSWQGAGLNVTGVDYFTLGRVSAGRSLRFQPCDDTFQSWIGGYLVRFNEDRAYSLQEHLNLAVIDQVNWLRHYGDPSPSCELREAAFHRAGTTRVSGHPTTIYTGGGYSHTDIHSGRPNSWLRFAASVLAMAFNANGASPPVTAAALIPGGSEESYARIFLKCIIMVVEIEPLVHAVLYGNGISDIEIPNGVKRDTFKLIEPRLRQSLAGVVITKL